MNTQTQKPSVLRYRPDEITVERNAPFENDRLNRRPFVEKTTDLIKSLQEPFVLAMNAPWGSGKTTTLRMLEPHLESNGITTISFNAWEVDYTTDPLVPLIATLHERLKELTQAPNQLDKGTLDKFKRVGGTVLKHTAFTAMKVATAGLLDAAAISRDISQATVDAVKEASENIASDIIDIFQEEQKSAEEFRSVLEELVKVARAAHLSQGGKNPDEQDENPIIPPMVLLIDELDRCRPTFAIAMLERIKHFFQVPGIVFVLSLDLKQLQASTRKVYGSDLDASEYLRRFIDLELRLPQADMGLMIDAMLSNCGSDEFFNSRKKSYSLSEDRQSLVRLLKDLSLYLDLPARLVQRIVSRLILVIRQTHENQYLDPYLIILLLFLRVSNEQLLKSYLSGALTANQVMKAVSDMAPRGKEFYDSHTGILIEAELLYGHNKPDSYTSKFKKHASEIAQNSSDPEEVRTKKVAEYFEQLTRGSYYRHWIDLEDMDSRINLVSSGLTAR